MNKTRCGLAFAFCFLLCLAVHLHSVAEHVDEADTKPDKVKAAVAELDKLIAKAMQTAGVPGLSLAVVHKDQVVFLKGYGVREVGKEDKVDPDTVFQLASLSKPIASTVLASMVSEGHIDWDSRVIDLDPAFRLTDPWVTREITLRDLLCHRSGLPAYAGDDLADLGYDRTEVLHRLRYLQPASSFRTRYAYANFPFTQAGVAGARVAGKTWEELAAEKLYRPLGMTSTSSRFANFAAAKNRALPHVRGDGKWVASPGHSRDASSPAGGASSTARDLAAWMRLHLAGGAWGGKQLIATKALEETHTPQVIRPIDPDTKTASSYGLGWVVSSDNHGRVHWKHDGDFADGVRTHVALLPAEELGVVVLTNAFPTGLPEGISDSLFELVRTGKQQTDWFAAWDTIWTKRVEQMSKQLQPGTTKYSRPPTKPSPALSTETYVGTYANEYFGDVAVIEKAGTLTLQMGPQKTPLPLRHYDRDVFVLLSDGESGKSLGGVLFSIGPDRLAKTVTIEALDLQHQGLFTRRTDPK